MPVSDIPSMSPALRASLDPLLPWLYGRSDVVEVSINGPGDLWIEHACGEYRRENGAGMDRSWAELLCEHLRVIFHRPFNVDSWPILASQLPGGHRLQAVLGSNTRSGLVISVRVQRRKSFALEDFGLKPGAAALAGGLATRSSGFDSGHPVGTYEDLVEVMREGLPVLISGGTNSGKTSFLNTLLTGVPDSARIIVVEDVEEVRVGQPNAVGLLADEAQTGTKIGHQHLLKAVLRLNPTIVISGEQQLENTFPSYRVLNSGHRGWMSTIHADSPIDALEAWRTNMTMALQSSAAADAALPVLVRKLARIVQLSERREVVEIVRPADLDWRQLLGRSG